jgi:acetylornithine/N-succinyldiaminopimelate aminotransferase
MSLVDQPLVERLRRGQAMHLDHYDGARLPFTCLQSTGIHHRLISTEGARAGETFDVLDASGGYASACLGAGHPVIRNAVVDAVTTSGAVTDEIGSLERVRLLESLFGSDGFLVPPFDGELYHASGRNSGSEGVELALRLALESRFDRRNLTLRDAKRSRNGVLVFEGAWHGWTHGTMPLLNRRHFTIGLPRWSADGGDSDIRVIHAPFANQLILEEVFKEHGDTLLAVVVEPVQGDAGIIVPPSGYLRALATQCQRHDVLLLADEVLTFAKTGQWLAMADEDGPIPTDITVLGKSIGMGVVSTSLVVARRDLSIRASGAVSTYDLRPLTCAIIRHGMTYIRENDLLDRSRRLGCDLRARLHAELLTAFPKIFAEVRGVGFLNGLALTEPASHHVRTLRSRIIEHGVYVEVMAGAGRRSRHQPFLLPAIRVAPPLVASEDELISIVGGIRAGAAAFAAA